MLLHLFPVTLLGWGVQIAFSLVVAFLLLSLTEYVAHRYFMHEGMPKWVHRVFPVLRTLIHDHRELHHQVYYHQFDHEPDPVGRDVNIRIGVEHMAMAAFCLLPYFFVTFWYISLVPSLVLLGFGLLHLALWNTIHTEMHQPKYPFWSRWKLYEFLGRHHFLHHRDTRTGFNVVFPLFDYVFHTASVPVVEDEREIARLRFLPNPRP